VYQLRYFWPKFILLQAQLNKFQFHINTIPAALYASGLRQVVISPGSRNAPLIMAFARFNKIKCLSVLDERSAAFVALGIAKQTARPCAAICTSGSALANFYPAVLEAHYMQVPLLIISADRPPEMIDRWDGQTIHQYNLFHPHIKASFQYPLFDGIDQSDAVLDICNDFYKSAIIGVNGPVHLNVPMDEPLYEAVSETFEYPVISESRSVIAEKHESQTLDSKHLEILNQSGKILYLTGTQNLSDDELLHLNELNLKIPVLADITSNNRVFNEFNHWEIALNSVDESYWQRLKPDVLISSGKMLLNKKLKQLLRQSPPKLHVHLDPNGYCADTFFSHPVVVKTTPRDFFSRIHLDHLQSEYFDNWMALCTRRSDKEQTFNFNVWSELTAIYYILKNLKNQILHLSNSMTVRNVAYLAQYLSHSVKVYCNRGVSGIDGCSSTAVGMALADSNNQHVLITGDLAFLYDINVFLMNERPSNLKIIVMNNNGGGIFRLIDGPSKMRELDPFMITPHNKNIGDIAQAYDIPFSSVDTLEGLKDELKDFFENPGMQLLEIKTNQIINNQIFNQFKQ